mmetsp:Transcript_13125/g.52346  ORF Transcript_13125/g.52346 Transcript_13125/m.52346 type:complete len:768 (-) Transcript_13125:53-2356(-)
MATLEDHQAELSRNVEQLVDAVSNLVLSTVTGDLSDIKGHCEGIATYTDKVVLRAKDIAIASRDKETQLEVTRCINGVASSIEKLVTAFVALIQDTSSTAAKKAFASAAKDVGIAINELIVSADKVNSERLVRSVKEAVEAEQLLLKSVNAPPDVLMQAARHFGSTAINVKKLSEHTSSGTANQNKAAMLNHLATELGRGTQEYIKAINEVHKGPNGENKADLAAQYKGLLRLFNDVTEAAGMTMDFSGRLNDAFDRFNKMLDMAKTLKGAVADLADLVMRGCTAEEFMAAAKAAVAATAGLIQQALKALEEEKDPVRREQIKQAIAELKEQSSAYMKSARAVQQNPNDEAAKQAMLADKAAMDKGVDKLVALTSKDMEEQKLFHTTKYLEAACAEMMSRAPTPAGPDSTDAKKLSDITERVVKDAKNLAMATSDPAKRDCVLKSTTDLQKAGDRYFGDINNLSRNAGDNTLIQRLNGTHGIFLEQVRKVRVAAGLEKAAAKPRAIDASDDNDLVRAAKQQAQAALGMADDAELMIPHIKDPAKQELLRAAVGQLRKAAHDVIHYAQLAAADPDNLDLQLQLDGAQRELADSLHKVVGLTSSAAGELQALFASMLSEDAVLIGEIFEMAKKLLADIEQFVATAGTNPPKEVVMTAKALTAQTAEVSKRIRKVADETTDPSYKEQLVHFSRFMRDRATQVKMIAAVKVACGGDAGQVTAAANGLHSTVSECVSVLTASELKRRRKATADRAGQIRHIVEVWKRCKLTQ